MRTQEHLKSDLGIKQSSVNSRINPVSTWYPVCIILYTKLYKVENLKYPHLISRSSVQGKRFPHKSYDLWKILNNKNCLGLMSQEEEMSGFFQLSPLSLGNVYPPP